MAVRFDPATLRVSGSSAVVQDGVLTKVSVGLSNATATSDGRILYVSGHAEDSAGRLVWLDRHGTRLATIGDPVEFPRNVRVSPDGRRIALTIGPPGQGQIWIYDVSGAAQPLKVTFQNHSLFRSGRRMANGSRIWSARGRTSGCSRYPQMAAR